MLYSRDIELSPFTITVGGDTFDVPTYPIHVKGNEELLAMEDGSFICPNIHLFIQRWHYRWFVCKDGDWFSLRLLNEGA